VHIRVCFGYYTSLKMTNANPSTLQFPTRRLLGRLATAIALIVVVVAGVWLGRVPLLRKAADLWIVSDAVTPSDVAVVLGGDIEVRTFAAATLYKEGLVTKVLVSEVEQSPALKGMIPGHTELNRLALLKLGVPETAIETFGRANKSTKDEAVALRRWSDGRHILRFIIPTEIFPARRARWIFDREFAGSNAQIEIAAYDGPDYTRGNWWRTNEGIISFQNEIIKCLYYWLKY